MKKSIITIGLLTAIAGNAYADDAPTTAKTPTPDGHAYGGIAGQRVPAQSFGSYSHTVAGFAVAPSPGETPERRATPKKMMEEVNVGHVQHSNSRLVGEYMSNAANLREAERHTLSPEVAEQHRLAAILHDNEEQAQYRNTPAQVPAQAPMHTVVQPSLNSMSIASPKTTQPTNLFHTSQTVVQSIAVGDLVQGGVQPALTQAANPTYSDTLTFAQPSAVPAEKTTQTHPALVNTLTVTQPSAVPAEKTTQTHPSFVNTLTTSPESVSAVAMLTLQSPFATNTINVSVNTLPPQTRIQVTIKGVTTMTTAARIAAVNPQLQVVVPHIPSAITAHTSHQRTEYRDSDSGTGNGANNAANSRSANGLGGGNHIGGGGAQSGSRNIGHW